MKASRIELSADWFVGRTTRENRINGKPALTCSSLPEESGTLLHHDATLPRIERDERRIFLRMVGRLLFCGAAMFAGLMALRGP